MRWRWCALGAWAALAGCASVPADWGRGEALRLAAERGRERPQVADVDDWTARALQVPITRAGAVQLALVHNPALRRHAAQLGFAAADVYDAARRADPRLSAARLSGDSSRGANLPQLTFGLALDVVNLVFLPARQRFAAAQLQAAQQEMADAALDLAARTESAWYAAVAAERVARLREAAADAQASAAELSRRYRAAGNASTRTLALEEAAASQALLVSIAARAEADVAAQRLQRLMGLAPSARWHLDLNLPLPPAQDEDVAALQALALEQRLDLSALRQRAQALAGDERLSRRTRALDGLELGVERERDFDGALNAGPTLDLRLPLFSLGQGRHTAAQAARVQAQAALDARVLDVADEVAQAAAQLRAHRSRAQVFGARLIPQLETALAQAQAEQNYMLIGVFELLAARQQTYEAHAGHVAAVRDYWIARSELRRAVGRDLPNDAQPHAHLPDPLSAAPAVPSHSHPHAHAPADAAEDAAHAHH